MPISLYQATIPPFIHSLTNLSAFLKKGAAHADDTGLPRSTLLEGRIIADMLPFPAQIRIACNSAKGVASNLGGIEAVTTQENGVTFEELEQQIQQTIDLLKTLKEDSMDGKEKTEVILGGGKFKFSGEDYVTKFAIPNFYFHVTTAYAILRQNGVPIGKADYLGNSR